MAAKNQGGERVSPFAPLSRMISAERFSTYLKAIIYLANHGNPG